MNTDFKAGEILVLLISILCIFGLITHGFKMRTTVCDEYKMIVSVGGCDKYGECGVTLSDGSVKTDMFPSVGKSFCTKSHVEWK